MGKGGVKQDHANQNAHTSKKEVVKKGECL